VYIIIADDGQGINLKRVYEKAKEKNLIDLNRNYSDEEIINFIMLPGFSTAETVNAIAGRGVGMDVVRNKIEGLNGQIEVTTKLGEGTVTRIKLPLTLAIIEALLVRVTKEIYAIPLANIVETIDIAVDTIKVIQNENVIVLRGEVVPIVDLANVLQEPGYVKSEKETITVVIVKMGNKKIGIIVEFLIGQQEIVIKSLGKLFTGIKGITGATVLGNGEVALILDVLTLV
jgi:two-component system chemotaxis sensor kinase CheA